MVISTSPTRRYEKLPALTRCHPLRLPESTSETLVGFSPHFRIGLLNITLLENKNKEATKKKYTNNYIYIKSENLYPFGIIE